MSVGDPSGSLDGRVALVAEATRGAGRGIDREQGRLDVLVNDTWGAGKLVEWDAAAWEHSLEADLRMLRLAALRADAGALRRW